MKFIFKCIFLNLLILSLPLSYAQSKINENKFLETLEGVCLFNKNDFAHIDKIAISLKLKPIPIEVLQGDNVIANRGGKGYTIEYGEEKFLVGYAVDGGCSVVSFQINLNELKKTLLSIYKLKLVKTDDEGMQVTEFYRFDAVSSYAGDYLIITYPRERKEQDIVSVSYLPEKVYLKSLKEGKSD